MLSRRGKYAITLKPALAFGIALSIGVGLLSYFVTVRIIDRDNEERFRNMAHTAQYTLNARIRAYTNVLRATASMFRAQGNVGRTQFRRFVEGLNIEENYPAIEVINYVQWLTDDQRDAFEARVLNDDVLAKDGRPIFKITPPGRRPDYSVVLYVEPNPFWTQAIGIDLNVQPRVHDALMLARDTGILATSGAPIKVMKQVNRVGLGMRLPVYRPGAVLDSVEARRAAYVGSVGIAFNVQRLVQGILTELPVKNARLTLFNKVNAAAPGEPQRSQLIYDSFATDANPRPPMPRADNTSEFHVEVPVEFNGREWRAHFSVPRHELYRTSDGSFPLLALLAGFATTMLLYGGFYTLTSSRKRAVELASVMTQELRESQEQLLLSHQKLRQLAAHAEHIKESERKRIAREIHDDLGQNLLALRIEAQLLSSRTSTNHPRLHARAESTLGHIDATIKSVRQIINDLRPNVLDLGLNAAVEWQIAEFRSRTGIDCELVEHQKDIIVSDQCATALFRILQESLTNVQRHASATWVRVDLRVERGWLWMSVRDNGVGLPHGESHKPGRFGLIGIEERVNILGGRFSITGAAGAGTTVEVAIPAFQEPGHDESDEISFELPEHDHEVV